MGDVLLVGGAMMRGPDFDEVLKADHFILSSKWQFASTMPWCPHEYTLKRWTDSNEFEEFAHYIKDFGTLSKRTLWERVYLDVGKYYYWYMSSPEKATLINRARSEDDAKVLAHVQKKRRRVE